MRILTVLVVIDPTVTDQGFSRVCDTFVRQYADVAPEGIATFVMSKVPSEAVSPDAYAGSIPLFNTENSEPSDSFLI